LIFVVFDTISHHIINKYQKWFILKPFLPNKLLKKSQRLTGIVVRQLGQLVSKYVIKKLDKIKQNFLILFSGTLSTNEYATSTCFAKILASNGSLSSGM